ncbi:hypothetical protein PFISCL1PPCAC_15903, partial [Pristionchus fissidentatus]
LTASFPMQNLHGSQQEFDFDALMRRSEEGFLLRKKQEQWAKEKEEHVDNWFPFGSPGGGNPNKKHVARDYEVKSIRASTAATENVPPQDPSTSMRQVTVDCAPRLQQYDEEKPPNTASHYGVAAASAAAPHPYMQHPMMYATTAAGAAGSMQPMEYIQQYHYAPMPAYPPYAYPGGVVDGAPSASGYPPFPTYPPHHMIPVHVLPHGTIPIPVSIPQPVGNTMNSSYSERWVNDWTNPHMGGSGTTIEEMPEDASSTCGAVLPMATQHAHTTTTVCTMQLQQQPPQELPYAPPPAAAAAVAQSRDVPHAYISPFSSAAAPKAQHSSEEDEYAGYKAQIMERRRLEAEEEERSRREEEKIMRERREKEEAKRRDEEKREEEERKREEDRERAAQAVIEAIEKAKKEAELMKKMRLHRHALEGAAGSPVIDGMDGRRVEEMKREVDAFERHKRLDQEEIARNAPRKEEKKRGMSLSRSPSISAHYDSGRGATSTDESSRSRPRAPSTPSAPLASPFRRAASLALASGAAKRTQQSAAAASPTPPRSAVGSPAFQRDSNTRFSLRGTPSPQGVVSRYAHLNQSPAPSARVTTPVAAAVRSPSVGRPPVPPPRTRASAAGGGGGQMNFSMPSRDSPLSRTFHAGDRTRRSMNEKAKSSGYGVGGNWLFSYSPSASRSATPDRLGWSGRTESSVTPEPPQRRGREEERRRDCREESFDDGRSSPRSNDTFITSPTVTATSRVDEPRIRYAEPLDDRTPEYSRRDRSMSRPSSRQENVDDYGRRSQIPIPAPRTRFTPPTPPQTSVTNPLFTPITTRSRKMRISSKDTPAYRRENSMESSVTSNDSGASSGSEGNGANEGIRKITASERVVPAIKVDASTEETDEVPLKMFTPRFSSRPSTPSGERGGLRHYSERMREMGTATTPDRLREPLTPTVQPRAGSLEPSSSLSASLRNLRASISNLNMAGVGVSDSLSPSSSSSSGRAPVSVGVSPLTSTASSTTLDSPGLTRFHSRTSQYRSFNTKKGTEKQQQLLDRLVSLRNRLQDTQSYKDRPLSRQGSTLSINGAGLSRFTASP